MKLLSVLLEKINDPYCTTFHCEGGLPHLPLTFHLCTKLGVPAPNILYVCVRTYIQVPLCGCDAPVSMHTDTRVSVCVSHVVHTHALSTCAAGTPARPHVAHTRPRGILTLKGTSPRGHACVPKHTCPPSDPATTASLHSPPRPGRPLRLPPP